MAISVTTDLAAISLCESTADGGTHYRLAGASSGNPAADGDAMVQNTSCIANKCSTTQSADVGGHFNATATFDITGKMLFYWRQILTPGNMLAKASQGITLGLTNTSTTSTSAWSTTNYKKWFMDGYDTLPVSPGWVPYCLDPTQAADASAGTLTLSSVRNIGFLCRQNSGVTSTLSNHFYDGIRMGTGITLTASSGSDVATLDSLYNADTTITNRWGLMTKQAGIYYAAGKINIGGTGQSNACNLTDSNQVLIWRKNRVADSYQGFDLQGASGYKTTVTFTGLVMRGEQAQKWNITCGANGDWKSYNCAISDLNAATLSAGSVISGGSVSASGLITANGATISGVAFSGQTGTKQITTAPSGIATLQNNSFTSPGTGQAIEITGTAADCTLTGTTFTGYAASSGSSGNEAIFVNIASGAMTISISGGSTPSIRTAGCTVTVSSAVTVTLTGLRNPTEVRVFNQGTTTERSGTGAENVTTGTHAFGLPSGTAVDISILSLGYQNLRILNYSTTANATVPISQVIDRQYLNP